VFTAFHFPEIRTNLLVGSSVDVNTGCPEYKVVAVDVRPVSEQAARTPALASV
jgi:formate dehydrogenase major subunit